MGKKGKEPPWEVSARETHDRRVSVTNPFGNEVAVFRRRRDGSVTVNNPAWEQRAYIYSATGPAGIPAAQFKEAVEQLTEGEL